MGISTNASSMARALAGKIAGPVQDAMREHRSEVIHATGNLPERLAMDLVYPFLVREVPVGLEIVMDAALTELGSMSISDLAAKLVDHMRDKGQSIHPSYSQGE